MSEAELIKRAQAGDRDALNELVGNHQARMRAFVARFVPDQHDVLDIVQDAFLSALKSLDTFDTSREFGPWLRTVCRNHVSNFYRKKGRARQGWLALVDEALADRIAETQVAGEDHNDQIQSLRRCIDRLSPHHKSLIQLRYYDRTGVQNIAAQLSRNASSVSQMLYRVRESLLKCMRNLSEAVT